MSSRCLHELSSTSTRASSHLYSFSCPHLISVAYWKLPFSSPPPCEASSPGKLLRCRRLSAWLASLCKNHSRRRRLSWYCINGIILGTFYRFLWAWGASNYSIGSWLPFLLKVWISCNKSILYYYFIVSLFGLHQIWVREISIWIFFAR